MNRDTVIDLAKQAKVFFDDRKVNYCFYPNQLLEFAALVAAHEREECAKLCDAQAVGRRALEHYAALTYSGAANDCAGAIRSRE